MYTKEVNHMMKKLTALLLALALLLSMTTAFAWSCPSCGSDNGGKFCTECGTQKPEDVICPSCGTNYGNAVPKFCTECGQKLGASAPAATAAPTATPAPAAAPAAEEPVITYATQLDNGTIGFMWEADGKQEYTVEFILKQSDDPYADKAANGGFNVISGTNGDGIISCSQIIPGEDYWLGLFDEQGRGHYAPFEGNATGEYTELELTPLVLPQRIVDGKKREMAAYSLEEIEAGEKCGLYFGIHYKNPGEEKEYAAHIILETPNGVRYPIEGTIAFAAGGDKTLMTGWDGMNLTGYFEKVKRLLGQVPLGEYKVTLYLDMAHAFTQTFKVQEKAIPVATATPAPAALTLAETQVAPNGLVKVFWTGGKAPYQQAYYAWKSDDVKADFQTAEATNQLCLEENINETSQTLYEIIPGEKYWIVVCDAEEKLAYTTFSTPVTAFTDFPAELVLSSNPVDKDKSNLATDFDNGVYGGFVVDNPGDPREVYLLCVVDYGNGVKNVTESGRWVVATGKSCIDLGSYDSMEAMREDLCQAAGQTTENDMTLSIYLDGQLAGQAVLPVDKGPALKITGLKDQMDGTYLLTWEDNGNGPWHVNFVEHWSDDFAADTKDARSSAYWSDATDLTVTSHVLQYLVPGMSYWIEVEDSKGNSAAMTYDVGVWKAPMNAWIDVTPRVADGEKYRDLSSFSVSNVNNDSCGLYLEFNYDTIQTNTSKMAQFVLKLPNGVSFCPSAVNMNLYADGTTYWDFWDLNWEFGRVKAWNGDILLGKYVLDVYIEGEYAASAVFYVTDDTVNNNDLYGVEIISINENADGTATVTWTDANNNGPYEIKYVQKYTSDFDTDCETGTGLWIDDEEVALGSYTMRYLVPGQAYWICVYDKDGYGTFAPYTPAAAQAFPEFTMKMELTPVWRLGSDMKVSEFSSAEIGLGTSEHGLELWIGHPQLARTRNYLGVVSITSPDGSRVSVSTSDWQLDRGEAKSVGWRFFDLAWYFGIMKNNLGAVPVGTYTVEFFCDGELACTGSFRVTD